MIDCNLVTVEDLCELHELGLEFVIEDGDITDVIYETQGTYIKYLSLFSGIGAFEKALDNSGIPYELVAYCDFDKYASKSYSAIHNVPESMNLGDITKVDEKALPKNIDLVTYGFPCQDISLAGKQKGLFNEDGTQTRSGLFFEALRIIEATQPRIAIAENVKNLTSKKFEGQFKIVLESLEQAGYNNYWQVLNAKDYGIPQNRERVFIVSIRKDIDTGCFQFPEGFPLELRLKDMLDEEVDEKYYIKDYKTISVDNDHQISLHGGKWDKLHESARRAYSEDYVSPTLPTCQGGNIERKVYFIDKEPKEPTIQRIDIPQTVKVRKYPVDTDALCEVLRHHKALADQNNNGIANALDLPVTKVEHWFRRDDCFAIPDPDVWFRLKELLEITTDEFDESIMTFEEKEGVYEKSERHYFEDGISPTLTSATAGNEKIITACVMRGRYNAEGKVEQNVEVSDREYANAITTVQKDSLIADNLIIRKLTPKECFRLQGFDDESFYKAEAVNSNTQLYKQAGNSICVPVVEHITKALIQANIL